MATAEKAASTNHDQLSLWGYQPNQQGRDQGHGLPQQSAQPQISLHGYQPDQQLIDQALGLNRPTDKPQR
jgi:hypothetical protein